MTTVKPESRLFDFEYQFVKYGEFHSNKINQLIHLIFVPIILWTGQVWGCFTPVISDWPLDGLAGLNAAFLFTAIYIIYYISLHKVIGLLYAPVLLSMLIGANWFAETENAAMVSTGLHVFAWVVQVWLGHHVFEGRAPAITENPVQGAVLGGLFVFVEFLFGLGLFPTLRKRLEIQINAKSLAFKNKSK